MNATEIPDDPWKAFAFFVGKCAEVLGAKLLAQGRTETQARNMIVGCFLDMAAGEACRIARREEREPDPAKWEKATTEAFERAVTRTTNSPELGPKQVPEPEKLVGAAGFEPATPTPPE